MFDEMISKIVIGVILLIALLPTIIWRIIVRVNFAKRVNDVLSKPFVCPVCGFRFYNKKVRVLSTGADKALLKCPSCGKRHICGRPYDIDSND